MKRHVGIRLTSREKPAMSTAVLALRWADTIWVLFLQTGC